MDLSFFKMCCGGAEVRSRPKPLDIWETVEKNSVDESKTSTPRSIIQFHDAARLQAKAIEYDKQALLNERLKEKYGVFKNSLENAEIEAKERAQLYDKLVTEQRATLLWSNSTQASTNIEEIKFVPKSSYSESSSAAMSAFSSHDFLLARLHFYQARHYAIENNDEEGTARAEANLSNVYMSLSKYRLALVHTKRALRLLRKLKKAVLEGYVLANGVACSIQLKRYDEALGYSLRKLAISITSEESAEAEDWIDKINRAINEDLSISLLDSKTVLHND